MTLSNGTLIRDRYRVGRLIASGGMASVYQAFDTRRGDEPRALKHYHAEAAQRHAGVAAREGRLLQSLRHESLPTAYDFFSGGGEEVVVLDYFPGASLYEALKWGASPPPLATALAWARSLLDVLVYLHAQEPPVLHRDINPTNLVVLDAERIALIDFSIAARAGREDAGEVIAGGTPPYAPPEQWAGAAADRSADIYAAGATIYHLLTNVAPPDLYKSHVLKIEPPQPPRPARELNPRLSPALSDVLARAMAYDPRERPASAEEMRDVIAAELYFFTTRSSTQYARPPAPPELRVVPGAGGGEPRTLETPAPAFELASAPVLESVSEPESPQVYDDDVAFTVFAPSVVAPEKWYEMLAFANLAERRPDAPADEPDPVEEVRRQAARVLGERLDEYREKSEESSGAVPRAGELIFKPYVEGFEFNPESRVVRWEESVHREEFKLRAARRLDGREARGHLRVYLGPVILAQITLKVSVDSRAATERAPATTETARPLRRVFASYSHLDREIVERIEQTVRRSHLGIEYLRDATKLRAGEVWNDELMRMIDRADMFQLFWSHNAMRSPFVGQEIEYALKLARRRPYFILPVYWETPFPERPEEKLPPEELRSLHFEHLSEFVPATHPAPAPAAAESRPVTLPAANYADAEAPPFIAASRAASYSARAGSACRRCGSVYPAGVRFCGRCGSALEDGARDAAPTGAATVVAAMPEMPRTLEAPPSNTGATLAAPTSYARADEEQPRSIKVYPLFGAAPAPAQASRGGAGRLAGALGVALMVIPTGLAAAILYGSVSYTGGGQGEAGQSGSFAVLLGLAGCGALFLLGLIILILRRRG